MEKIVITGASGNVGSALIRRMSCETDTEVIGLSRRDMSKEDTSALCRWEVSDYSAGSLRGLLEGAHSVVHLAGTLGSGSRLEDYDDDLRMTKTVLEEAAAAGIKRLIYASSRLVYGNPETTPWSEDTCPEPMIPYAVNKMRCEDLCRRMSVMSGMECIILRIAQVLSAYDRYPNMINAFIKAARNGDTLTVMGRSIARRQYIYSEDLAEVICRLIERDEQLPEVINAGMTRAYTNLEIADAVNAAFHNNKPIIYENYRPEKITSSIMDVSRMIELTGHVPMDMESALEDIYTRTVNVSDQSGIL